MCVACCGALEGRFALAFLSSPARFENVTEMEIRESLVGVKAEVKANNEAQTIIVRRGRMRTGVSSMAASSNLVYAQMRNSWELGSVPRITCCD